MKSEFHPPDFTIKPIFEPVKKYIRVHFELPRISRRFAPKWNYLNFYFYADFGKEWWLSCSVENIYRRTIMTLCVNNRSIISRH
jgi:hypothetical protein